MDAPNLIAPQAIGKGKGKERSNGADHGAIPANRGADIASINKDHFVTRYGGRALVVRLEWDDALKRKAHRFIKPTDMILFYGNVRVPVGKDADGHVKTIPLGAYWLGAKERRTFDRMVLAPGRKVPAGVYNLWVGWGCRPVPGHWLNIARHLRNVICCGNHEHFKYLVRWMAYCVQHPDKPAGVAVVMRGDKGAGKGLTARILQRFFAGHALHIMNSRHLTGNFNAHLLDALFVYADEAFYAGDKQGEGVLKTLITEATIPIERKGVDVYEAPNMIKLLMASNSDWVVPVTADERRYFILDVSNCKRDDLDYFQRLADAIDGKEGAAFLHFLLKLDLSAFKIQAIPDTKAMAEQKLIGGNSVQRWWYSCVERGSIDPGSSKWPEPFGKGTIGRERCRKFYEDWCVASGERRPEGEAMFGKHLRALCPDGKLRTERPWGGDRSRVYVPATLACHREAFLKAMKIRPCDHDWHDDDA